MIANRYTSTVTVATPTGATVSSEGHATPTMATATVRCAIQPAPLASIEDETNVETATSTLLMWCAPTETLEHTSTVTVDGVAHAVIGRPRRWAVGSRNDHLEALLRRVDQ